MGKKPESLGVVVVESPGCVRCTGGPTFRALGTPSEFAHGKTEEDVKEHVVGEADGVAIAIVGIHCVGST